MKLIQMQSKYRQQPTLAATYAMNETQTLEFAGSGSRRSAVAELPEGLQSKMEASLGHDFSTVMLKKDSHEAAEMGALAFAQNEEVHFAPGQFNPNTEKGKNIIGHEFTHIAQQRNGRVNQTAVSAKGFAVNDDPGLENEADTLGKKAVRGEKIGKYQASNSASGSGENTSNSAAQQKSGVVQMAKHTSSFGDWYDDTFTIGVSDGQQSVKMDMRFDPNDKTDAELIAISQTVKSVKNNAPYYINGNLTIKGRSIDALGAKTINSGTGETDEGTHIDQLKAVHSPLYAISSLPATDNALDQTLPVPGDVTQENTWGKFGFNYMAGATKKHQEATLHDETGLNAASLNSAQIFETTALAIKGNHKDMYYGSVEWGWRTDGSGTHTKIPFKVVSEGTPSSTFMKAVEIWNGGSDAGGNKNIALPHETVELVSNPSGVDLGPGPVYTKLPFGTRVVVTNWNMAESVIRVVDGPFIGMTGSVPTVDLTNER